MEDLINACKTKEELEELDFRTEEGQSQDDMDLM
jgi:hypothetical protein